MPDVHAYFWDDTAAGGLGAWRTRTRNLYIWDAGASVWRTLQNCWIWDGAAWRKFFTTTPGVAASVSISPGSATVDVTISGTCNFTYAAYDQDGVGTSLGTPSWSTTDPSGSVVAGTYTAGSFDGHYDVSVTVNGITSTASVEVTGHGI